MSTALRVFRPATPLWRLGNATSYRARRSYATGDLPRPPPSKQPEATTFSGPSKPRAYYARPHLRNDDLPPLTRTWPATLAIGTFGVAAWALFLLYTTNEEKLASSVVARVLDSVRSSSEVQDLLGDTIRPEPKWWLSGQPWIEGVVNVVQGKVDITFRLKGHKGAGTLYFTSIRKGKGQPFEILRFKVIGDNGTVVHVQPF